MCTYACMCVVVHWLEKDFFLFNKKQHKRSHLAIFCSFSFNFFPACLAFSACDFALCHYVRFRCVADMCSVYYAYDLQHCTIISIPATNNIKNKRPFFYIDILICANLFIYLRFVHGKNIVRFLLKPKSRVDFKEPTYYYFGWVFELYILVRKCHRHRCCCYFAFVGSECLPCPASLYAQRIIWCLFTFWTALSIEIN